MKLHLCFVGGLLFLVVAFSGSVMAQTNPSTPTFLIRHSYNPDTGFADALSRMVQKVTQEFKKRNGQLAIRVCSRNILPLALVEASGKPFVISTELKKNGIDRSKIIYLRSSRCTDGRINEFDTELWFIADGSEFPPYEEMRRASSLDGHLFLRNSYLPESGKLVTYYEGEDCKDEELSLGRFDRMLDRLTALAARDATKLIILEEPKVENATMSKRLKEIKAALLARGVSGYRILTTKSVFERAAINPQIWVVSQ